MNKPEEDDLRRYKNWAIQVFTSGKIDFTGIIDPDKIPEILDSRIIGLEYEIDALNRLGEYDIADRVIRINKDMDLMELEPQEMKGICIHEMIHALFTYWHQMNGEFVSVGTGAFQLTRVDSAYRALNEGITEWIVEKLGFPYGKTVYKPFIGVVKLIELELGEKVVLGLCKDTSDLDKAEALGVDLKDLRTFSAIMDEMNNSYSKLGGLKFVKKALEKKDKGEDLEEFEEKQIAEYTKLYEEFCSKVDDPQNQISFSEFLDQQIRTYNDKLGTSNISFLNVLNGKYFIKLEREVLSVEDFTLDAENARKARKISEIITLLTNYSSVEIRELEKLKEYFDEKARIYEESQISKRTEKERKIVESFVGKKRKWKKTGKRVLLSRTGGKRLSGRVVLPEDKAIGEKENPKNETEKNDENIETR